MKDQYAGDVGDYVKLALLRFLAVDRSLAVAWYKTADDASGDGRHRQYLEAANEDEWRSLDPELYDQLGEIGSGQKPTIDALQKILDGPQRYFFDMLIEGPSARAPWFAQLSLWLTRPDILFLDPDNGIASAGFSGSIKSVTSEEVEYLRHQAKTIIIYHHQTRSKGGHAEEIKRIGQQLMPAYNYQAICAIRAGRRSPRAFFIVAPDRELWDRAEAFADHWSKHVTFHPLSAAPDELGLTPGASAYHRVDAREARGLPQTVNFP